MRNKCAYSLCTKESHKNATIYCIGHYTQFLNCKPLRPLYPFRAPRLNPRLCEKETCNKRHYAVGLCRAHYCKSKYKSKKDINNGNISRSN